MGTYMNSSKYCKEYDHEYYSGSDINSAWWIYLKCDGVKVGKTPDNRYYYSYANDVFVLVKPFLREDFHKVIQRATSLKAFI